MKHVSIVGGGLAGLTLGIGLRRQGIPVTIWERGQYPRHRVCGEFSGGRGQGVWQWWGLRERSLEGGGGGWPLGSGFGGKAFPLPFGRRDNIHDIEFAESSSADEGKECCRSWVCSSSHWKRAPCAPRQQCFFLVTRRGQCAHCRRR